MINGNIMFIAKLKFTVSSISQNISWMLPNWQWSISCSKEKSLFSTLSPALGIQWWVSLWSISATLLQRTFCPYRDFRSHFSFSSFWLTFFGFCFILLFQWSFVFAWIHSPSYLFSIFWLSFDTEWSFFIFMAFHSF